VSLILIYDIEDDRLRTRASEICLDYGLERIQFSAFFGKLNRNRRQELALRLQREIGGGSARVRMVPVCEDDLRDMWVLEQYRVDADELKAAAEGGRPASLRILKGDG
jgi:CRISPR-associated protein Cas2